jgi:putative methyltransferase
MGGPNFIYNDNQWIKKFFHTNPFIDLFIVKEGEHSFLKCLELMLENDLDLKKSDYSRWPSTFYSFDFKKDQVINNPNLPVDRLDLTSLPSPYLSGLLDEFLADKRLAPIIETNRGCPYHCAFCYWGGSNSYKNPSIRIKNRH